MLNGLVHLSLSDDAEYFGQIGIVWAKNNWVIAGERRKPG